MRASAGLFVLLLLSHPVVANGRGDASPEAQIVAVIGSWYEELRRREDGRPDRTVAPGFINASPYYGHIDTGAASLGPRVYPTLAATALTFRYDIERMRIDPNFAKVAVWERGYFFAAKAQKTYERAAATDFVLERSEGDGQWRILAHQSGSYGIPPGKVTDPMPDLADLFYATVGADRDREADAEAAGKF
jgi:hypothetical protein